MSKQCLYIEQAKHLKELGVGKITSDIFWVKYIGDEYVKLKNICKCGEFLIKTRGEISIQEKIDDCELIPTFTLQDILDLLPKEIMDKDNDKFVLKFEYGILYGVWYIGYYYYDVSFNDKCCFSGKNLIDAAYEMLCWCIENGYVKTNKED